MALSPQQRITKLKEFHDIVTNQGFDELINNHLKDICEATVSEKEWLELALADTELNKKINNLPASEKEKLFNPTQTSTSQGKDNPIDTTNAIPFEKVVPLPHPEIREPDGSGVLFLKDTVFENWDKTIVTLPKYTFFPKSKEAIQNIIKWAKVHEPNLNIRASGYRHTSSNVYGDNNEILISMLDYETALHIPATHPPMDPANNLQGIQLVGEIEENGEKKMLCKMGSATCNYHIRKWVHDPQGGNSKWCLPDNVVMTEITVAGLITVICHGAGLSTQTLSDLVAEIEYIDANGNIQTIKDPEQLKAASGSMGVFGIITSVTLKLDKMTYANLVTQEKKPLLFTIPPPTYNDIPDNLKPYVSKEMYEASKAEFQKHVDNDYYLEWFWFPFNSNNLLEENCWVNCWKNNGDPNQAIRYPQHGKVMEAETYLANLVNMSFFKCGILTGQQQANILGKVTMATLPNHKNTVCTLEDAEHFRNNGIQNIRQVMAEFEVNIPPRKDDPTKPDLTYVQKLWWDVVNRANAPENQKNFPLRTTLEMRLMGGSNVTMAPERGNKWTASIEILSIPVYDHKIWTNFVQQCVDEWSKHKGPDGKPLKILPHWAKGFENLTMNNMPIWDYLKLAYKDNIEEFKKQMENMAKEGHYNIEDMKARFTNATLRKFFFDKSNQTRTQQQPTKNEKSDDGCTHPMLNLDKNPSEKKDVHEDGYAHPMLNLSKR